MLQTQGRRRAFEAEGTAHTTAWRECVLGSDAEVKRAGLQRASNAERSRAGREGSLVKEDMTGLGRHRMVKSRDSGLVNLRIRKTSAPCVE